MQPLDGLLHLLGFVAPALVVGALTAALAKLCWRRQLADVRWRRLAAWAAAASALALAGGLVAFGRDGHMASYAAMLAGNALALWWAGFGPARR